MIHHRRTGSRAVLTLPSVTGARRRNRHPAQNREESDAVAWNDTAVPRLQRGASWSAAARSLAHVGTVAALLAVAACSSSTGKSTSATTAPTSTSTTVRSDVAVVIGNYKAAELAAINAGMIPDPNDVQLAATHVDPMLKQERDVLRGYQLRGVALRYPKPVDKSYDITVDPSSVDVTDGTAVLEACVVDAGSRVDTSTQKPVDPDPTPTTFLFRVGMRRDGSVWKLAEREQVRSWKGRTTCAAS